MMILSSVSVGLAAETLGGVEVVGAPAIDAGLEGREWGIIGGPTGPLLETLGRLHGALMGRFGGKGLTMGGWGWLTGMPGPDPGGPGGPPPG